MATCQRVSQNYARPCLVWQSHKMNHSTSQYAIYAEIDSTLHVKQPGGTETGQYCLLQPAQTFGRRIAQGHMRLPTTTCRE